ncbi:hypothetical protein E3E11_06725 [Oecophyllibacter saccharovorans]|uniref:hypothetical protein n=1 Tax=Oecophyllibacter saccharovorans TaxID=2558360 RepID=UPI001142A9D0|nr:hypothetical protein [Oecophyllibacter saccharovorans]QDH15599.1 hypothetical protein E3E11_06725 [Oecophyllibacter saccharovorans]
MVALPPVAPLLLFLALYGFCRGYLNPLIRGISKKIYQKNFQNTAEFIMGGNPQKFRRKLRAAIIFETNSSEYSGILEGNVTKKEKTEIGEEILIETLEKYSKNLCRSGNWITIITISLTAQYFSTKIPFLKSILEATKIIEISTSLPSSPRAFLVYFIIGCFGSMLGGLIHHRGVQLRRVALLKSPS